MKRIISLAALTVMLLITSLPIIGAQRRPPSADIPLRVIIEGIPNDPGGYRIVGDGREYVDGQEGVYAKIQVDNGTNDFIMDPTDKSVSFPRALYFDFTDRIADGTIANPWQGLGLTKIDTFLNFDRVNTVAVGPFVEERVGGLGQLFSGGKKINYRVVFNTIPSAVNYTVINTPNFTAPLEVSHPDCNTWIITPKSVPYADFGYGSGSGAVAALIGNSNTSQSTGQYLMPFKITLLRKNPLNPCP